MRNFHTQKQKKIIKSFNKNGYYIFDIKDKKSLKKIKKITINLSEKFLKKKLKKNFLENTHHYINSDKLNKFRMKIYSNLNSKKWLLHSYYQIAKKELSILCGNELVMQRKINLSIQMPEDDSSLLPLHSDVWSGCSPFEVVIWIPLVDCKNTNSMYILPKDKNDFLYKNLKFFNSVDEIEKKFLKHAKSLNIKYGQGLIFLQSILHGNKVNNEKTTRWSFNCRFKSIFSPYDKKAIGETFLPITLKAVSINAMNYKDPDVKKKNF